MTNCPFVVHKPCGLPYPGPLVSAGVNCPFIIVNGNGCKMDILSILMDSGYVLMTGFVSIRIQEFRIRLSFAWKPDLKIGDYLFINLEMNQSQCLFKIGNVNQLYFR